MKKKIENQTVYLQKSSMTIMEFCPFDRALESAILPGHEGFVELGDLDIKDGCSKEELIRKLKDAAKRLEKYTEGDIFVIE